MRKYDRISSLVWCLFGLCIVWEGYSLNIGTINEPSTGFFIFWSGLILSGLSVLNFIKTQLSIERETVKRWEGLQWQRPLLVLIAGVIYTFFFESLGFLLSTLLLMVFLFKIAGINKWPIIIMASLLSVFCSWLVFFIWLQVQFPRGGPENFIIGILKLRY